MGGSQPSARGELHPTRPLHREALRPCASLRHPLILDGLFLRLRTLLDSAFGPRRAKRVGERNCACTFYLVFKEPALPDTDTALRARSRSLPDEAPEARSRVRSPSGVSPLGEPYNLTSAFLFVSTPVRVFFVVSGAARSLQRNETRRRTARGLCEPEGLLEDPATAGSRSVQQIYASDPRVSTPVAETVTQNRPAQPERSDQSDARSFTTC